MDSTLSLQNISKVYQDDNGEVLAVKNFTYDFKKGEFISIVGPSRMWKINYPFNYCRFGDSNYSEKFF